MQFFAGIDWHGMVQIMHPYSFYPISSQIRLGNNKKNKWSWANKQQKHRKEQIKWTIIIVKFTPRLKQQ